MLTGEQLKERIDAARTLRGMTQNDLAALLAADGHGKHDLGRIERADPRMPFSASHRRSLAYHLRVPESWFTVDELEFPDDQDMEDAQQLDRLEEHVENIERMLTLLLQHQGIIPVEEPASAPVPDRIPEPQRPAAHRRAS